MKITIFASRFQDGGIERLMLSTADGLLQLGASVTLLFPETEASPMHGQIPAQAQLLKLASGRAAAIRSRFKQHLLEDKPDVVLSYRTRDHHLLLALRKQHAPQTVILLTSGSVLSTKLSRAKGFSAWKWRYRIHRQWRKADGVICFSHSIAADWRDTVPGWADKVHTLPNPLIRTDIQTLAEQPVQHPWLQHKTEPVILGVGRLAEPKNFPLLLRAFARLRQQRHCRLIILGEGKKRAELEALIAELQLGDSVSLPGFSQNPYQFMHHADLFALSSVQEDYGIVLVEALALGTPVVSTDCPMGPKEILQQGRLGQLVPMHDEERFAQAMAQTLDNPPEAPFLQAAVREHTVENSAEAYLGLMQELIE